MAFRNPHNEHQRNPDERTWGRENAKNPDLEQAPKIRKGRPGRPFRKPRSYEDRASTSEHKVEVPPPKYLSKTNSEIKNDPLYEEAFFPGPSEELREIARDGKLFPGADGFMELAKHSYQMIISRSATYKKSVPESAHVYYCGIALFYRLLKLHSLNQGVLTYNEAQFLEQFELGKYKVPKSIQKYLAGFGNTQLPSGVKQYFAFHKPKLVAADGIPGFFGKIMDNPGAYASYPSPGVLAQRVRTDVQHKKGNADSWDLPKELAFSQAPINEKCIGYQNAVVLTPEQRQFLEMKQISGTRFPSSNPSIALNVSLLNGVAAHLTEVRGLNLCDIPEGINGSQGQLVTAIVPDSDCGEHNYQAFSSHDIRGAPAYLGATYLYRLKKLEKTENFAPNTSEVPFSTEYLDDVAKNSKGWDPKLDEYDYQSTVFNSAIRLRHVINMDLNYE